MNFQIGVNVFLELFQLFSRLLTKPFRAESDIIYNALNSTAKSISQVLRL